MKEMIVYKCNFCGKLFFKHTSKHMCLNKKYDKNTNVTEIVGYVNDFNRIYENKCKLEKQELKKYNGKVRNSIEFFNFIKSKYDDGYSANKIAKFCREKFNIRCGAACVIEILRLNGIITRTIKESNNMEDAKNSRINTCLELYGVTNPSQDEGVKQKKRDKFFINYGVDNIFKKVKYIRECMYNKYGVYNPVDIPRDENYKDSGRLSSPHQKIIALLDSLNIKYKTEQPLLDARRYNKFFKRIYCPRVDILLDERKVIEVYGDMWHANPKFYKKDDVFYCWTGKTMASDIWLKDKYREEQIRFSNYKLLIIWEEELCQTKNLIQKILKFVELKQ